MPSRVRIPAPYGSAGPVGAATAKVRLIGADGKPIMGFVGDDLRTEYARIPLVEDAIVDLAAQSEIAAAGGGQTWYEFTIATEVQSQTFKVQVPCLADIIDLRDLVAAQAVDPADILAGRLLPTLPADAAAGWVVSLGSDAITPGWAAPDDIAGVAFATAAQGLLADTAMQPVLYDPRGVRADIFSATNLTGAIDGGTF